MSVLIEIPYGSLSWVCLPALLSALYRRRARTDVSNQCGRDPGKGRLRVLLLLLACCLFSQPRSAAQVRKPLRVLIISELEPWSPANTAIDQEIFGALEKSSYQIELYSEDLDTVRFSDEAYRRQARGWYLSKYRDHKPDLMIGVGPTPIKFMASLQELLSPNTPIVFWGSTVESAEPPKLDAAFTGVWGIALPDKTLDLVLSLKPGTKHVVVVGGEAPYDRYLEAVVKQRLQRYESKLEFIYLTELAMFPILDRLKHLPSNTIVFHTSLMQNAAGARFIDSAESVPMVATAANAPVFILDEVDAGRGTVGGNVFSVSPAGQVAAGMAIRILSGEKPQDIPIVRGANVYVFDWPALKRWGLKESELPPGSVVLNREPSLWEAYRRYTLAGVLFLFVQALIIMGLLWQRAQRKQVQAALVRSNEQLRLAMDAGKSVGWDLDVKSGLNSWFGDLHTMFGISADKVTVLVGDIYRYVHPEDRERALEVASKSRTSREPYSTEFRIVWPNGTTRWVVARGKYDYARNGEAKRMLGMAVDITERKQIEQALKKSEEKFSKAFRESPLAFTLTSARDHRYIEVNETFERLTGWGRQEVIDRTPFDIGLWVEPAQRNEHVRRLLAEGSVRNVEIRFRTKGGEVRTGLGSFEVIEFDREPCVVSVVADVTELKRAEEAKEVSEQRFKQFFDALPEYCYMVSPDGLILDVNPAACEVFGYTKEELIGRSLSTLYAPESLPRMVALLEKWKRTGTVDNEEVVILTKQGKKRTVLLNAGSLKDAQGNLLCSASVQVDITEQKQIQERLCESQSRLEGIVASAMDAIIAVDQDQRIVVFNAAAERMFACPAKDAIGVSIDRFIPQRFRDAHREHIRRFGATSITNRAVDDPGALWGLRTNGEEFPMEATISQVGTGDKKLFTVLIRDVTERKRAEEARFRLAAIVESSDDAIISLDLEGVIVSWNISAQRMFGYTESEALGRPVAMIIPPELKEQEGRLLRRLRAGKGIMHYETVRLTKEGKSVDVSLTVSPLRDWTGKVIGVSKISRDITLSKRAETSLRESEERFRLVANSAPVMIWMSGPDRLRTYFNQPWLVFTGRSIQAELRNGWATGVHPEDLERCLNTYTKAFDRREPFEMEYRLRRHDGEYRWVSDLGVPRSNPDGSLAGYIGSCLDVTEHKLAEEALSSVSRRLIEAHEEERTWIARELHDDINQRIALLAVNLERLKQVLPASEHAVSQGLAEIAEQVSDIGSDIQALSHRLHSSRLEYLGIAAAASSFCRELSEKQRVEIDFHSQDLPRNLPQEVALCLFRVLQEALQNAVKHSGSRSFDVSLVGALKTIQLTVRDSGNGFDLEEAIKGRGIGLTSMKERVKLVHGELSIDSGPQRGTLIHVTVPLGYRAMSAQA